MAMSSAAYQALIPELVVKEAWGTAAGYCGMAMLIGTMLGLMIASTFDPWQTFLASLLLMTLGLFSLVSLREPDNPTETRREESAHIVNWRDFGFTFASRFCVMFGMTLLTVFILFFFKDVLKVAMLAIAGAILSSLWVGMYSDRVSRKLTVIAATAFMAFCRTGVRLLPGSTRDFRLWPAVRGGLGRLSFHGLGVGLGHLAADA